MQPSSQAREPHPEENLVNAFLTLSDNSERDAVYSELTAKFPSIADQITCTRSRPVLIVKQVQESELVSMKEFLGGRGKWHQEVKFEPNDELATPPLAIPWYHPSSLIPTSHFVHEITPLDKAEIKPPRAVDPESASTESEPPSSSPE